MRQKCLLLLVSFVILTIFLSGCVGKREINELSLVLAVGIDKAKDSNEIELTVTIARPADARGQTGAPAGNTGDPIRSVSSKGKTLFEAIRNLASFSTRRIFWAHNFIIVVNEEVAKDGIADILDFFTRNPELRMRTWIAITPNKAKDIVSTMTGLEVLPGEALDKLFRYSQISEGAPRSELIDVQAAYLGDTTQPVIARMRLIGRGVSNKKQGQSGAIKQVALEGAGVFKGDKLVGILKGDEIRGLLPFIEPIDMGMVVLTCPKKPEKLITAEIKNYKFNVTPKIKDGKPSFVVNLKADTNVVEAGCPFSIENKQQIRSLESEIEDKLKASIEKVIHKAQKDYKSDFLELGQRLNNKYPVEWKELKKNWDTTFPDADIRVNVDAEIKGGVLLYKPTRSGKIEGLK